jgi:hypothetical protein
VCHQVKSVRGGVTGGWRKLHNEGLHNLYPSPSIIRMMKFWRTPWAGHVAQTRGKRNARRILGIDVGLLH